MRSSRDDGQLEWVLKDARNGPAGYLKVKTRTYVMPDGNLADWDILMGGRTVAVVALTDDDEVLLVEQFRPGPGRVLLELPGGNVTDDEDIADAARRELAEETGYLADSVEIVGQTWLASYATHQRYAALARGCKPAPVADDPARAKADDLEFIRTVSISLDGFRKHARSGQLTDTDIAFMGLDHLAGFSAR